MISNRIPPTTMEAMRTNMRADGFFHAFVWLVTLAGVLTLWRAAYRREAIPSLIGYLLLGFGLFNLVEGIVDHYLLGLHYVRQVPDYFERYWG